MAGSAADDSPRDGLVRDDYSAPADWVLDDCWAAMQADDRSAPEAPPIGCSALARSAAGGLAPVDYSAPADFPDDSPADCRVDC
jgi:hypothetical protein